METIFLNINLFMNINEYTDLRSFCDTCISYSILKKYINYKLNKKYSLMYYNGLNQPKF